MPIECRAPQVRVEQWPVWFLKCFLEADKFARRKGFFAYSRQAYLQKGEGDLIIASRAGSTNPADWTASGKRASFFFLGSTVPLDKKDWEYAGVAWRGPSESAQFWLSYFIQQQRILRKEGEGHRFCWGQADDRGSMRDDVAEQQRLIEQVGKLAPPP
jgi:hypothetical protein